MAEGGLRKKEIEIRLVAADGLARSQTAGSMRDESPDWLSRITYFGDEKKCKSKSFLPCLVIALVARSLRPREKLDVLAIKAAEPLGYSASGIGGCLSRFRSEQKLDLRSKSSIFVTNGWFNKGNRLLPTFAEMSGRPSDADDYAYLYESLLEVQMMEPDHAFRILALLFDERRLPERKSPEIDLGGGLQAWEWFRGAVSQFVNEDSEDGRVGEAFVAAALDVAYPGAEVQMSKNHDPSFRAPGDVTVWSEGKLWLAAEARQKPQLTDDAVQFLEDAAERGVERVVFAALWNHRYRAAEIDRDEAKDRAKKVKVMIDVVDSSGELLDFVVRAGQGDLGDLTARFAERMLERLEEQNCTQDLIERYQTEVLRLSSG
jgi:hypothetical protein